MATLTGAIRETFALVIAWVGAVVGIFGAGYILGVSVTGDELSMCGGAPIISGVAFTLPTLVAITLAGATMLVGGFWSMGLRRRVLRVVMLAVVAALATGTVVLATAVAPGCGGGLLGL